MANNIFNDLRQVLKPSADEMVIRELENAGFALYYN